MSRNVIRPAARYSSRRIAGSVRLVLLSLSMAWTLSGCHTYDQDPKLAQLIADSKGRPVTGVVFHLAAIPAGAPAKLWAIACGGLLSAQNGEYQNCLAPTELTPKEIKSEKEALSSWWGVTDRESLIKVLQW